jgi:hypothetical protein
VKIAPMMGLKSAHVAFFIRLDLVLAYFHHVMVPPAGFDGGV